jgi:hypothetical protein
VDPQAAQRLGCEENCGCVQADKSGAANDQTLNSARLAPADVESRFTAKEISTT